MQPTTFKLSFCIATFNRAAFIGATLDALIKQVTNTCEIIVSDNASTDNTEQVVAEYARRFDRLRYFKQQKNIGLDRNFNTAMELARGEYCWLTTDDDVLKPGAVARVLEALHQDLSLVIVNMELRDFTLMKVHRYRWIDFRSDRLYKPIEMDRLFLELERTLMNIGNIIIKRSIWLQRERERYYGSLFIHIGVIFQKHLPGNALVIASPLINYRLGNAQSWSPKSMEILLHNWPSLIESLALSERARSKVKSAKPWTILHIMVLLRARGYSLVDYRRWIRPRATSIYERTMPVIVALIPQVLAIAFATCYNVIRYNLEHLLHSIEQRWPRLHYGRVRSR